MTLFLTSFSALYNESIQQISLLNGLNEIVRSISFDKANIFKYINADDSHANAVWYELEHSIATCVSLAPSDGDNLAAARHILSTYHTSMHHELDPKFNHAFTCALYDIKLNYLWISADWISSIPIWYAFQDGQYIISTDLLATHYMGFAEPSSLGAGQVMHIDLSTQEIVNIDQDWYINQQNHVAETDILEVYTRRLALAAISAIETTIKTQHSNKSRVTIEIDRMDTSSLFLDCALDALEIERAVRYTRPRIVDSTPVEDAWFHAILSNVSAEFMRTPSASAREESFQSIAIAQWQVCQASAPVVVEGGGGSAILLSFDSGVSSRPVEVYLQNLFCRRAHVTVVYPFRDPQVQAAVYATRHVTSYFHEALEVLRSPNHTHNSVGTSPFPAHPKRASVYSTSFCPNTFTHGSRKWTQKDLSGCIKSNCVDKIVKYDKPCPYIETNLSEMNNTELIKPNALINIWQSVRHHSSTNGIIILLLVTKGYIDMLINFLCATQRIDVSNILVLTQDTEVVRIARLFQVGVYIPHSSSSTAETVSDADFGTLQYQELVFSRTELAMELLLAGYQPVIADIDAVWLSNPLQHLPWSALSSSDGGSRSNSGGSSTSTSTTANIEGKQEQEEFDIAITDDNGEVCGCFVALRHTDATVRFWNVVYIAHRELIQIAIQSGKFNSLDESEQKILTKLLYKGEYTDELSVLKLPEAAFPSGYAYFTLQTHRIQQETAPVIVHNNFIVGKSLKRARFQRYGMWSTLHIDSSGNTTSSATCVADATVSEWSKLFPKVSRNTSIPSLNMYLPVHGSVLAAGSEEVMVHVAAEGPVSIRFHAQAAGQSSGSVDLRFPVAHVYVGRNPPAHIEANPMAFAVLRVLPALQNSILAFTITTTRPDVAISADVGYLRREFSIDRQNKFAERANELVLYNIRMSRNTSTMHTNFHQLPYLEPNYGNDLCEVEESIHIGSADEQQGTSRPVLREMGYSIRVLAYNRPASLQRLLASLAAAQYSVNNSKDNSEINIPLFISIDGPRNTLDKDLVQQSVAIAEKFVWKLGSKSVHQHLSNMGLAQQWLSVWEAAGEHEAAFVFEDDVEVSPYYFLWASRAVQKYYTENPTQQQLQKDLLLAVRAHIATNGDEVREIPVSPSASNNNTTITTQKLSVLEEFAWKSAGKPLLYGVCLQKQHLDPNHYPRRMHARNGNRPFLYSLIGSWGPLLLPNAWRAFLEWQQWRSAQFTTGTSGAPETENLVINHFLQQNPNIWTPWHVRFAYETGAKCLYSNLPAELGLVANHREKGENYDTAAGPDAQLLQSVDISHSWMDIKALTTSTELNKIGNLNAATSALWYLPDTKTLSTFQYDFNLRRMGGFGADAAYTPAELSQAPYEYARTVQQVESAMVWTKVFHSLCRGEQQETADLFTNGGDTGQSQLSVVHWFHVASMLEACIPPGAHFLYLSPSPLLTLLSTPTSAYQQSFLSSAVGRTRQLWEQSQLQSGVAWLGWDSIAVLDSVKNSHLGHVDVLVIDTKEFALSQQSATRAAKVPTETPLHDIIRSLEIQQPAQYVLTLGACSSAPTDLSLAGPRYGAAVGMNIDGSEESTGEWQLVDYVMVEDMCSIDDVDVGAVLYRLASASNIPADRRFATSRRLEGGLQSRRMHDAAGLVS